MENRLVDPVEAGKRIRDLRGDVPRSVVSRKLGIPYSSLEYYESGKRMPPDESKVKLADYYGRSVQEIFFE